MILKANFWRWYLSLHIIVALIMFLFAINIDQAAYAAAAPFFLENRSCIIIDAGHGGIDGGAASCTGMPESRINLEIAIKLDTLLHLLGFSTKMIRTEDISVHIYGSTISQKKISDLKERLRIVNETEKGLLISIHQNYFFDSQYRGAQVFYATTPGSKELAEIIQKSFCASDCYNHRSHKQATGIFLMKHVKSTAILIECGFLSNPQEEALLRNADYQKKLCCIIAANITLFLDHSATN